MARKDGDKRQWFSGDLRSRLPDVSDWEEGPRGALAPQGGVSSWADKNVLELDKSL